MRLDPATLTFCGLGLALLASPASAQYDLSWHSVDGGGAMFTTGGLYELSGTIGQPDAGAVMTGGAFELTGGFWAGVAAEVPACPGDLDGDNQVSLSDLAILLSNFGTPAGAGLGDGDTDADGDVDLADLAFLLSRFGTIC